MMNVRFPGLSITRIYELEYMHMTWSVWKALISKRYSLSFAKNLKFAYKQTLIIKKLIHSILWGCYKKSGLLGSFLIKIVCTWLATLLLLQSYLIWGLTVGLTCKLFCFWKSFNISKESSSNKRLQLSIKYHLRRLKFKLKRKQENRTSRLHILKQKLVSLKTPNFQYSQQCFPPNI